MESESQTNPKTLKELNEDFHDFDESARNLIASSENADDATLVASLQKKWLSLFPDLLSEEDAMKMLDHYRKVQGEMKGGKSKKSLKNIRRTKETRKNGKKELRKQKGGMAPIGASMGPGFPTMQTYGSFPSDITSSLSMSKALDIVGGNPGINASCGKEESLWPTPSATMGSNKVGGGKKTRKNKKRTNGERMNGGGLIDSLSLRAYIPTVPSNVVQTAQTTYQGVAQPPSGDPTTEAWKYSASSGGVINPAITKIGSDINQLATPAPWGKS
jgi:hypothetical protein